MSRDVVPLRESSLLTSRQRLASLLHGTSTLQLFICDMDRVRSCYRPGRQPGISNSSDFIRSSFGHCPLGRCIIVRNRDSCGFHGAVKTHTSQGRSVTPSSDRLPHFPCDKRTRKTMFSSCLVCNIINRLDYIIIKNACKPNEIKKGW